MSSLDVEALAGEARRRAALVVLRAHRDLSLEELFSLGGPHRDVVESLTLRELWGHDPRRAAGLPRLRTTRYERAARTHGRHFDALVLEVLEEVGGFVRTGYLRARLGGGRPWKVKGALERLCALQLVVRVGATSDTFYCLASLVEDGDDE